MARWLRDPRPQRIEGPAWYRSFDPAAWDTPDAQEQSMIDGCRSFGEWPEELHRWHAQRRWEQAKHEYRKTHPQLAEQEFEELVNEELAARRRERNRDE